MGTESLLYNKMGRVRTKTVKRASKVMIERFYPKLTLDFETNKRLTSELAVIQSKRLRNKIAGYTTHLMKRIQKGPVRGISFKLQEEERERKDQYVPEVSALDLSHTNGQLEVMLKPLTWLNHWVSRFHCKQSTFHLKEVQDVSPRETKGGKSGSFVN